MQFPPELLEKIFYDNIDTLIISQFLNTEMRNLTNKKFNKLDRNLLLTQFTKPACKFKANKDLIVIHKSEDCTVSFEYIKSLTDNCYLITSDEYLGLLNVYDKAELGRVSYVYGKKITSQVYIHPCKMIVKNSDTKTIHVNHIIGKDESLKDLMFSRDYLEVNFKTVFDIESCIW
jgi:hypothetical protein